MHSFSLLQHIVPESYEKLLLRISILNKIHEFQPVGRRNLAKQLDLTERVLRSETDVLRKQHLISYSTQGMSLTENGTTLMDWLEMARFKNALMSKKELKVSQALGISHCRIVWNENSHSIGQGVQSLLNYLLPLGDSTIAVVGGKTMANVAEAFDESLGKQRELTFVPARGGVGGSTLIQANSVSEQMAFKTKGRHSSLYVPEHISQESYQLLMQEPAIANAIHLMKTANCLLYSIGNADVMAKRRGLSEEDSQFIEEQQAVGEAFGCFFNQDGQIILQLPRVGLHLSDLTNIPHSIVVISGVEKIEALKAYIKLAPLSNTWFVLDEDVANMVLSEETR